MTTKNVYYCVEVKRGTIPHCAYVERVFEHEAKIHAKIAKDLGYSQIRVIQQKQFEAEARRRRDESRSNKDRSNAENVEKKEGKRGRRKADPKRADS